jgi:hypothetical protein
VDAAANGSNGNHVVPAKIASEVTISPKRIGDLRAKSLFSMTARRFIDTKPAEITEVCPRRMEGHSKSPSNADITDRATTKFAVLSLVPESTSALIDAIGIQAMKSKVML